MSESYSSPVPKKNDRAQSSPQNFCPYFRIAHLSHTGLKQSAHLATLTTLETWLHFVQVAIRPKYIKGRKVGQCYLQIPSREDTEGSALFV